MKVQITQCSFVFAWYKDDIGKVFDIARVCDWKGEDCKGVYTGIDCYNIYTGFIKEEDYRIIEKETPETKSAGFKYWLKDQWLRSQRKEIWRHDFNERFKDFT